MNTKFHNRNGTLTPYAFACGYIETYGPLKINREPNDWHVKGFLNDKHVWEIFETLTKARAYARKHGGKLTTTG